MSCKLASALLPWLLCIVLVAAAGPAIAGDEDKKDDAKSSEKAQKEAGAKGAAESGRSDNDDEAVVFTNEDLERLFGGDESESTIDDAAPAAGKPPAVRPGTRDEKPKPADPNKPLLLLEEQKAQQAEWSRQVAAAEADVEAARKKVTDLDYRLRATRNPFLARPEIPEDEQGKWSGLTASERAARTQQQIDMAREELETAQSKLDALRARRP